MPVMETSARRPSSSNALVANANSVGSQRGHVARSGRGTSQSVDHDSSRKHGSKSSLFSVFSRSKVDKQRAHDESRTGVQEVTEIIPPRSGSSQSTRSSRTNKHSQTRSLTSRSNTINDSPGVSSDSISSRHQSLRSKDHKGFGQMPPLFQAYAQAAMSSRAQTADSATQLPSNSRRGSSSDISFRSDRPRRSGSVSSHRPLVLSRKIFALTSLDILLQYSDQGMSDRLPERVLYLTKHSSAEPCNSIPGESFVLSVNRDSRQMDAAYSSSVPLLSRMGLRRTPICVEAHCMLLILQNETEFFHWNKALNKTISSLGQTATQSNSAREVSSPAPGDIQNMRLDSAIDGQKDSAFAVHHLSSITSTLDGFVLPPPHKLETLNDISEESLGLRPRTRSSLHECFKANSCAVTKDQACPARRPSRSGRDSTKKSSQDSSASVRGQTYEEEIRSRLPFKLRSAIIPEPQPSPRVSAKSQPPTLASPMQTPQRDTFPSNDDASLVDYSRPKSILAELPNFYNAHIMSSATTAAIPISSAVGTSQSTSRVTSFRTAEPSRPRQPRTRQLALPLKVNTSLVAKEPGTTRESPSPISPLSPISANVVSETSKTQTPRSSSFSLFPTSKTAPSPLVTPTRPQTPIKDTRTTRLTAPYNTIHHRLDRSASRTSKPKKAHDRPPVSPISPTHSGTWPNVPPSQHHGFATSYNDLTAAQSNIHPTLRSSSPPNQRPFPPRTSSRSTTPDLIANTSSSHPSKHLLAPRSASAQGTHLTSPRHLPTFPRPGIPGHLQRPGTSGSGGGGGAGSGGPKRRSGSAGGPVRLPELDLGIPVIGLAPPVPPPERGLPCLPTRVIDVEERVRVSVRGRVKEGRGKEGRMRKEGGM